MGDQTAKTTSKDVAQYMWEQIQQHGTLDREDVAEDIKKRFGDEWVGETELGHIKVADKVLSQFRKLYGTTVYYENFRDGGGAWYYTAPTPSAS